MTPTTSRLSPLLLGNFSRDYFIVHGIDVVDSPSGFAEMDWALLRALEDAIGGPIIGKAGNTHYEFEASSTIPAKTAALPDLGRDNQLLILK